MPDLASTIHAANAALIGAWDLEAVGRYFTPDYVAHVTDRDLSGGHETIRRILGMLRSAFPELEVEVEILVESDDRIAWQRTLSGVQRGPYAGFPAIGRIVTWRDMVTSRFDDGRIAEDWVVTDLAERLLRARKS